MRPSKLRLPLSTDATTRSFSPITCRDFLRQRPRVADARRAAIAHRLKLQLLQVRQQPRARQVFGHHHRSRSQRRLHPRRHCHPLLDGLLRHQSRRHHHRRIRRIRAARDRRDHHAAVVQQRSPCQLPSRCPPPAHPSRPGRLLSPSAPPASEEPAAPASTASAAPR